MIVEASEKFEMFKVVCPDCEWPHWLYKHQYEYPGYPIVCDCGKTFKVNAGKKEEKKKEINNVLIKEVAELLVAQGYDKSDALNRARGSYKENRTFEELVVDAIRIA